LSDEREVTAQIFAEFERLGLDLAESPYQGMVSSEPGEAERFLSRLRGMQLGLTWWDVFPDIPAHWVPGRPETWTVRYRPLGPYDYQELPTGPAVHVAWPRDTDPECLPAFVSAARDASWPIYGAGFLTVQTPAWPTLDAFVVLESGTSDDALGAFASWVEARPGVELAAIPRTGDEEYAP
jgi:hypothetical protein